MTRRRFLRNTSLATTALSMQGIYPAFVSRYLDPWRGDPQPALKELAAQLEGAHYYLRQTNLEDVFLKATGRVLNE